MSAPAISICIPAYKAEKYLRATLDSIRAQTFTNWELIVTEDGSRDSTEQIVNDFARTVSQPVRYTRHDPNRGLPGTRNAGIAHAAADWIAFIDADDLWTPEHLANLFAQTRELPCELAFSGTQLFDSSTGAYEEIHAPSFEDEKNLPATIFSGKFLILPSSVLIARRCFEQHGPVNTEFPICNDTELWLRLLRAGATFRYSGMVSCLYRQHADSMSKKAAATLSETARVLLRFSDWAAIPAQLRRERPADLLRYAARHAASSGEAIRLLSQAVRANPRDSRNWAKLALACLGRR